MTFAEAIRSCLTTNYARIHGRAARAEYWWFVLFDILLTAAANIVDAGLGTNFVSALAALAALALLLPGICVGVRRLHDRDRSGWWLLISLVPILGWIVLLVWYVQPGTPGPNRFGPDPLAA